jgi:hypothetical protein
MGVAPPEIDTELGDEEDAVPPGPRIRCPLLRLETRKERHVVLQLRLYLEHPRHRRRLPGLPASMDIDTVPVLWPLVAALRLVRGAVG